MKIYEKAQVEYKKTEEIMTLVVDALYDTLNQDDLEPQKYEPTESKTTIEYNICGRDMLFEFSCYQTKAYINIYEVDTLIDGEKAYTLRSSGEGIEILQDGSIAEIALATDVDSLNNYLENLINSTIPRTS